jgi:anti-sigma factor RsiW
METGIHELSAGYALDALDPDERRAFEEHLEGCERCQEELGAFQETATALALAAAGPAPSDGLRDRILDTARTEPQNVVSFVPRRDRLVPVLGAVAAVAAAVAIGVGVWAIQLSDDLDEAELALEEQREAAAILADPSASTVQLSSGQGRLVVNEDGRAALVLQGVDPAPTGKTYEMWIVENEQPAPAGLFDGHEGTEVVVVDGTVVPGAAVAVTLEDDGGAETPTPPLIVVSEPVQGT